MSTLLTNLISYWKLDEASGNASDSHGSNTGVVSNITYVAGKINNAARFNGTTSKITLGNAPFNFTGDYSVSFWHYVPVGYNSDGYLCSRASGTSPFVQWNIYISDANNGFVFQMNNTGAGATNAINASGIATGTWYHIVATISGTNMLLYVNGTAGSSATFSGTRPSLSIDTTYGIRSSGGAGITEGDIDEGGIWDKALTASEVTELYNGGAGLSYPFTSTANTGAFFAFF